MSIAEPKIALQRARFGPAPEPEDLCVPLPPRFKLESGERLPDDCIRLRRYGRSDVPLVLVMGGISSGRKLAGEGGWWNDMIGEGRAIDLQHHAALGIDFAPGGDDRIQISPADQARLTTYALDFLGIDKLHAVVGASYGGMTALAMGAVAPERVGALCIISAAHRPHSLASAWRGVQRRIVEFATEQGAPNQGLALARQLAMITYRSGEEFEQRFDNVLDAEGIGDVDRYLIARGEAYNATMSPRRWLSLSESIDRAIVRPEDVRAQTTLVACPTDQIAPIALMEELAERLPRCTALHTLPSLYGHDAFLKETERLGGIISNLLRTP